MSRQPFSSRAFLDVAAVNLDSKKVYELPLTPPIPATAKVTSIVARCVVPLGNQVEPVFAMNGTLHILKIVDPARQKPLRKDQIISLNLGMPRREYMSLIVMNKAPPGSMIEGKLEIIYTYFFPHRAGAKMHTPVATVADQARRQVQDAALKRNHEATPQFVSVSSTVMAAAEQAAHAAVKQVKKVASQK